MSGIRVSFIIVNFNGGKMLEKCLASIKAQSFRDFEVVVVDNGSSDGSCDIPVFSLPGWQLVRLGRNAGFAEANNIGLAQCRGNYIALVNNDVVLADSWTAEMVRVMDSYDSAGSVACRIVQDQEPRLLDSAGFSFYSFGRCSSWYGEQADSLSGKKHEPFGAVATAALYRRSAIDRAGFFHPEYFAYYEDTDLAVRMTLHGYKCVYSHASVAFHAGSATGKRHSDFHRYYLRRNIELLYWVDMVGMLAVKHFIPHFCYETMCFAGMLLKGQCTVFVRAKIAALKMLPWILGQRRLLRSRLEKDMRLSTAGRNLESRMISAWNVLFPR